RSSQTTNRSPSKKAGEPDVANSFGEPERVGVVALRGGLRAVRVPLPGTDADGAVLAGRPVSAPQAAVGAASRACAEAAPASHRGKRSGCIGRASHTFAVPSMLAVTIRVPSGLNIAEYTQALCPLRVRVWAPVFASHTFAVWSSLAVTMRVPSAL